ncbi:hypothetical protein J7M00_01695, partial [bacterium]|nr:hypothetical protein [bacterium]
KRGQINNFNRKLEFLYNLHGDNLTGIMYFIDPELIKNKNYYNEQLEEFSEFYGIELHLFYGKELFDFLDIPFMWDKIIKWLKKWKDELPELPDINFDINPQKSFNDIKNLEIRYFRKILLNNKLWEEKIIHSLFKTGSTLKKLLSYFEHQRKTPYDNLASLLRDKLSIYYSK